MHDLLAMFSSALVPRQMPPRFACFSEWLTVNVKSPRLHLMNEQANPTVGFIGLGIMGAAMAAKLQKAGSRLVVNDARRGHRAACRSGRGLGRHAARGGVVFTCLPGLRQERAGVKIKADPAAIQDVLRRDPPAPTGVKHG